MNMKKEQDEELGINLHIFKNFLKLFHALIQLIYLILFIYKYFIDDDLDELYNELSRFLYLPPSVDRIFIDLN